MEELEKIYNLLHQIFPVTNMLSYTAFGPFFCMLLEEWCYANNESAPELASKLAELICEVNKDEGPYISRFDEEKDLNSTRIRVTDVMTNQKKGEHVMWREGTIGIPMANSKYDVLKFHININDEACDEGIEGGKIIVLCLMHKDDVVANFDKGWIKEPDSLEAKLAIEILMHEHN